MNPALVLRSARLVLTPVGGADLPALRAIKAEPSVFAVMSGGVRDQGQTADDLARHVVNWGRYGFGTWVVREAVTNEPPWGNAHRALSW